MAIADKEELEGVIDSEFHNLSVAIQAYKSNAIDGNKTQLRSLLTDEIIRRYFYSEGLYTYYTANNSEIKKALSILNNPKQYASILR
jgi:carboxyl-terminal processing protease